MTTTIGSLYDAKNYAFAFQPLLLVTIKQNDGTVLNLCTHDLTNDPSHDVDFGTHSLNSPRSFVLPFELAKKIDPDAVGDVEYLPRITNQDIAVTQAMSEDGIDITPTVTLRIADPNSELFINFELDSVLGFKGAEMTLHLVLMDMAGFTVDPIDSTKATFTSSFSSDVLGCFIGQCNPITQDNDTEIIIAAVSKLNMKRILIPTIPVEKRCPWILPRRYTTTVTDTFGNVITTVVDEWAGVKMTTNAATGQVITTNFPGASDPTSQLYYCGFDNGATRGNQGVFPTDLTILDWTTKSAPNWSNGGAHHCGYTKQGCLALGMYGGDNAGRQTGSFGGFQYDIAANNQMDWSGKSYIEGVQMEGVGSRALAKYNNYVPLVYGTSWVDAIVMNVLGDPNSTRGEAVCCSEEVGEVVTVLVNDIVCPPGQFRYSGSSTEQSPLEQAILSDYGTPLDNPPYLDIALVPIVYVWNTTPILVDLAYPVKLTTGDRVYISYVGGFEPASNSFIGAIFGVNQHVTNSANGLWTIVVNNKDVNGKTTRVALIGSAGNMTYQGGDNHGWLSTMIPFDSKNTINTFRWQPINYGGRNGLPLGDAPYNGAGDPYGNYCAVEWVVPISVAQSNAVPSVRALIDGPKLPVFTDTSSSYVAGDNLTLLNAYVKMGSPYNENPVWQILNILIRSSWTYDKIDLESFIRAAHVCQEKVFYTDQFGIQQTHARFACSFTINKRKPTSDVLRALRMSCGALLMPGSNGLLMIVIKQDIARQQPSPIPGSNNNDPINISLPINTGNGNVQFFPYTGYLAYDFTEADILRNGDKTTFKIHQNPIQQSPNRVQVSFQDKENAYQQDGLTIIDDYDYNNVAQVDTQLQMEGPNTYDHVQRIVTTMLAEYHKGNPSAQSHGTIQFTFDTTYRAAHLRVGHIVRLKFTQRGINQQLCRVTAISPSQNFEGLRITMSWHDDIWYSDAFGQGLVQDSGSLGANSVNRPPFGWQPWLEQPNSADPLDGPLPQTDWNFQVSQAYFKNADDSLAAQLNVTGILPINQFSQRVRRPIVPPQGSFSTTGGTFIGPRTYYIGLCAIDSDGKYSSPSMLTLVNITQTTTTGSISVKDVICDRSTAKIAVFVGSTQQTMTFHSIVTPESLAKFSVSVSDLKIRTWGMPDVAFSSITIKVKEIIHSGTFGVAITSVGGGVLGVAGAGWTTDEWKGRQCTIVSHIAANGGHPLPIWNFTVTGNTADTLLVTPDPSGGEVIAVEVGDALIMRFKAQVTVTDPTNDGGNFIQSQTIHITDPLIINSLNGFGELVDVINSVDNGDGTTTVFTDGPHGFDGTHLIYIAGVAGATQLNARWPTIVVTSDTTFTVPTSSSAYAGGGTSAQQILGLIPHEEKGNIFRVIGGPGAGSTAVVADNDTTSWTLAQPLAAGIDDTSIFIIEEGSWKFQQNTGKIQNSIAPSTDGTTKIPNPPLLSMSVPVDNWVGDTLLVMGVAVDVNGNETPEVISPFREAYMLGASGATFIRDWLCKGIIGDDPMIVGTDVMVNHYRVRCNKGEYVQLLDTAIQSKDAPVGAAAKFDVLVSRDNGSTWTTIFTSQISLPAGQTAAAYDGTQFAINKLYRDNLLRYDIVQIGTTNPGGLIEIDIKGKVFA